MFVYILHYETPIHHAHHYTGSTTHLYRRLLQHATGNGACLTKEFHRLGIPFTLGKLFQCTNEKSARSLEKKLKLRKNGPRYCEKCEDKYTPVNGAIPYPVKEINKSLKSIQLLLKEEKEREILH